MDSFRINPAWSAVSPAEAIAAVGKAEADVSHTYFTAIAKEPILHS